MQAEEGLPDETDSGPLLLLTEDYSIWPLYAVQSQLGTQTRPHTSFPRSPLQLAHTHTHTHTHTYAHIYMQRERESHLSIPQDPWGIGSRKTKDTKICIYSSCLQKRVLYSHITYTSFHTLQIISVLFIIPNTMQLLYKSM